MSPLGGILFLGWDVYLVLMLHLLAAFVHGAFLALRAITLTPSSLRYFDHPFKDSSKQADGVAQDHKGSPSLTRITISCLTIFVIAVPLVMFAVILSKEFGKPWLASVGSLGDFVDVVVISSGLWVPLALVAIWAGLSYLNDVVLPRLPFFPGHWAIRFRRGELARLSPDLQGFLYERAIVTLQMVVIAIAFGLGVLFSAFFGVAAVVVLLVGLKTAVAVFLEAGAVVDAKPVTKAAPWK